MSILTREKIPSQYKDSLVDDRNKFNSDQLLIIFIFLLVLSLVMSTQHYLKTGYSNKHLLLFLYGLHFLSLGLLAILYFIPYFIYLRKCKNLKKLGLVNLVYLCIAIFSMNLQIYLDVVFGHDLISYIGMILVVSTVLWLDFKSYLLINTFSMIVILISLNNLPPDVVPKSFHTPQVFVLYILGWIVYLNNRKIRREDYLHRKLLEVYSQRLLEKSMVEPMTGFYNRRTMEEGLKKVHAIHKRAKRKYCIMLVDIDYFKKVNDKLGHLIGDSVIKETAKIIKSQMRESDIGYRYGGEEFLFVLSNTNLEEGLILAERIRQNVMNYCFTDVKWKITVSIGLALCNDDFTSLETVGLADKCLYKAKKTGRNRVVIEK